MKASALALTVNQSLIQEGLLPMDALIRRIAELERRCAAVERANRRWRAVALAVLTAGATAFGCGMQEGGRPVVAQTGVPVSVTKEVECELLRIKKDGKTFAELEAREGGAELLLCDATGDPRMELGFGDDGGPYINIVGPEGKFQYNLSVGKDGRVEELMRDKTGRISEVSTLIEVDGSVKATLKGGNATSELYGFKR
jgi:hypothetical protein